MILYFLVGHVIMSDMYDGGVGCKQAPGLKMGGGTYISLKWVKVKIHALRQPRYHWVTSSISWDLEENVHDILRVSGRHHYQLTWS